MTDNEHTQDEHAELRQFLNQAATLATRINSVGRGSDALMWVCALKLAIRIRIGQALHLEPELRERIQSEVAMLDQLIENVHLAFQAPLPGETEGAYVINMSNPAVKA
jgi:hypothetical protein